MKHPWEIFKSQPINTKTNTSQQISFFLSSNLPISFVLTRQNTSENINLVLFFVPICLVFVLPKRLSCPCLVVCCVVLSCLVLVLSASCLLLLSCLNPNPNHSPNLGAHAAICLAKGMRQRKGEKRGDIRFVVFLSCRVLSCRVVAFVLSCVVLSCLILSCRRLVFFCIFLSEP